MTAESTLGEGENALGLTVFNDSIINRLFAIIPILLSFFDNKSAKFLPIVNTMLSISEFLNNNISKGYEILYGMLDKILLNLYLLNNSSKTLNMLEFTTMSFKLIKSK